MNYYILKNRVPFPVQKPQQWIRSIRRGENLIAKHRLQSITVTTLFIGVNELLFQTIIKSTRGGVEIINYSNWKDAEKGHKDTVNVYSDFRHASAQSNLYVRLGKLEKLKD